MLFDTLANDPFIWERDIGEADKTSHAIKPAWWDKFGPKSAANLTPEQQKEFIEIIQANRGEYDRFADALKYAQKLRDDVSEKETFMLSLDSLDASRMEDFRQKMGDAHKFWLSPAFAETTMEKLATPETVVKAKAFFALTHDPMWVEWRYRNDPISGLVQAALMFSDPDSDQMCAYTVLGRSSYPRYSIKLVRFDPATLRLNGDNLEVDWELQSGRNDRDWTQNYMDFEIKLLCDFVIRINSPRITEFRQCEDLSRLNKKRMRNGRYPLSTYQIVDLSRTVRDSIKLSETEGGGVRFHWRRGHFKARETGLFWWNPHTAGRKAFGEIRKDYVA